METLTFTWQEEPYSSRVFRSYFDGLRTGVFDIETTGLEAGRSRLILGGFLFLRAGGFSGVQYFAENTWAERQVAEACVEELQKLDVVITYNGHRFDLPFLRRRCEELGLAWPREPLSFDLYRVLSRYSSLRQRLPNLKQKTVEGFLGLAPARKDAIDGRESILLYRRYCASGDPALRKAILLHNRDDVRQLARLLRILDKLDLHQILFHEGFGVALEEKRLFLRNIAFRKSTLLAEGSPRGIDTDYFAFQPAYHAEIRQSQDHLFLEVPLRSRGNQLLVPTEDFPQLSQKRDFLLLKDGAQLHFREINRLLQAISLEILRGL